jgi:hypothetical protein
MKTLAITRRALIVVACIGFSPCAPATGNGAASQPAIIDIPDECPPANGDVAELESLTRDGKVVVLRKAFNGSYGASLSYYAESMIY